MLSRAACVPRICLTCRLGLATSRAITARTSPHQTRWVRHRSYPSDPVIQSKERIEALISGSLDERASKESAKQSRKPRKSGQWQRGQRSKGGKHGSQKATIKELPDRALKPRKDIEAPLKADEGILDMEATKEESLAEEPELSTSNKQPTNELPETEIEPEQTFRDEFIDHKGLGVNALGRPIDALVIKNPNKMKRAKRPSRMIEEEVPAAPFELQLESLIREEGEETEEEALAEAMKNIDELRPIDTSILRMKDFDDLTNRLVDGFLYDQLLHYLVQKLSKNNGEMPETSSHEWIIKEEPWQAAKPDHFNWQLLTLKQRASIKILQTAWNLEVQEQMEGLGEKMVWLRPRVFDLISKPFSPVLGTLKAELLYESNRERISLDFDESRMDIYAPRSTIPVILARLDEILQSIASQKISVHHVKDKDLLPEVLEELGRITKTVIRHNEGIAELEISWLADDGRSHAAVTEQDEAARQTESPADIVLRLLMARRTPEFESTVQIITPSQDKKAKGGVFVSHQRERRSMSWRDKFGKWSRYVNPIGGASTENDASVQLSDEISLPAMSATTDRSKTDNRIVATFGHILHDEAQKKNMEQHRRILSPVVPHPAALTAITVEDKPVIQHTAIILNFAPNPSHAPGSKGRIPEIRLRLPVDPDTDLSNFSVPPNSTLHGVEPWHTNYLLLPSENVDVRLSQHALHPLDVNQQSLKDFLAVSEFNLLEGRLRTPSQTTFSIPNRWLSKRGRPATVNVPYMFMGLEIHQTVEVEWQGHTLRYSSIEAGQHGGQRQELSLEAKPEDEQKQPLANKDEKARFLELVEEVATGKHFSWHEGYQLMQERSDEQFSLDMLDEDFVEGEEESPSPQEPEESNTPLSSPEEDGSSQEPTQQDQQNSTDSSGSEEVEATLETTESPDTAPPVPLSEPNQKEST